jgi:hydrogenase expression/formation protein HypE
MTAELIERMFLPNLDLDSSHCEEDAALIEFGGKQMVVTTDAYVVNPIIFPGGDIGSLAVHGTINDLAMRGAQPQFMTASFILEEGLDMADLETIIISMAAACRKTGIKFLAGDTKVVNKGAGDKIFISTTGIGCALTTTPPSAKRAKAGDVVIVSGDIGRHGMAVMCARENLQFDHSIESDSAPLNDLVARMLAAASDIHCLRDITRGGLATVLVELAESSGVGMELFEKEIPVGPEVQAACELLGLDPLYVACEGRLVAIVAEKDAQPVLQAMHTHSEGQSARIVGKVVDTTKRVTLVSKIGGKRIIDKLSGLQLPRIC